MNYYTNARPRKAQDIELTLRDAAALVGLTEDVFRCLSPIPGGKVSFIRMQWKVWLRRVTISAEELIRVRDVVAGTRKGGTSTLKDALVKSLVLINAPVPRMEFCPLSGNLTTGTLKPGDQGYGVTPNRQGKPRE